MPVTCPLTSSFVHLVLILMGTSLGTTLRNLGTSSGISSKAEEKYILLIFKFLTVRVRNIATLVSKKEKQ